MVRLRDPLHNRQTQAKAAILPRARLIGAVEALEDVRRRLRSDASPIIGYSDSHIRKVNFQSGDDLPSGRRVADSVIEQVHHQAAEQFLVAAEWRSEERRVGKEGRSRVYTDH